MSKTRMTFTLEKDEDGYPPDDYETIWVEDLGGSKYRVDNIPFYVRGVSPDDVVEGERHGDILEYHKTLTRSDISVLRIVFFKGERVYSVLGKLVNEGCRWEESHLSSLYSVEMPASASWNRLKTFLDNEALGGVLDYEEASLRLHK
jgi:hypothetical protein